MGCSFCGCSDVTMKAGGLRLCGPCRSALCAVQPGDKRYAWFMSAVKQRLFPATATGQYPNPFAAAQSNAPSWP